MKARMPPAILQRFPEYAVLIAEIIGAWNTLEDQTTHLLTAFTGIHPRQCELIMSAMVNSQARLDVLRAMGQFALTNQAVQLTQLNEILDVLEKRLRVRNQYAHAVYVVND